MAAVSDRGQLLLAGAFVLAIALIGLTVALNASAQTTTLATNENPVSSGSHALTVRESVATSIATMIEHTNRGTVGNYGNDREAPFLSQVQVYANATRGYHGRRGRLVNVTEAPISNPVIRGARIEQDGDRLFNNPDPSATNPEDFQVAEQLYVRNVTFVLTSVTGTSTDPYTLVLSDPASGSSWELRIYNVGGVGGDVIVETKRQPTGPLRTCTVSGTPDDSNPLVVDISAGRVGDQYCPGFEEFGDGIGRYDTSFVNGNTLEGRYWMTIEDPSDSPSAPPSASIDITTAAVPTNNRDAVVYAANLRYRYHSASVSYEWDLRVAPGELS